MVLGLIAAIWSLSSLGYYVIVEEFNKPSGYSDGPRLFSLYYGAWCLVAFLVFHPALSAWAKLSAPVEDRIAPILMVAACVIFVVGVLPALPELTPPPEKNVNAIITADVWYFLPKSIEVLLQQILMAALVVVLAAQNMSVKKIAVLTAILFGGFHLSLVLSDASPFYVLRYTVAATLFGAITPYQMLKMRNGFVYSFTLHWAWYAFDTTIWRLLFA